MYPNQNYYPNGFYYTAGEQARTDTQLIHDIRKSIHAEYSAVTCYEKLIKLAPTQAEQKQIAEIKRDEQRHLARFSQLYRNLTGRQPTYQISEHCPDTFQEGLLFAFKDEQKSVDFYLEISDYTQDVTIKETFRRAAADEQNHAMWFLFFMRGE